MNTKFRYRCPYSNDVNSLNSDVIDTKDLWVQENVTAGDWIWLHPINDDIYGIGFKHEQDLIMFKIRFGA